ncbi:helix-turn-helix domain-containing protein [Streptomyces sp. NBC_00024]|uniref:helix-turn-helix domain-containing protein n=1 Tax=Streptomyces sp. NBC_00024 TaxID=2903612 RepID=UPI00324CC0D2
MAEEQTGGGEEAQRVFDALDALKAMEDPTAQAKAISAFLREQGKRIKELSDLRRDYVLDERKKKVPHRKIAENIGVSPSTVQDIERGYSGSGRSRPRTKKATSKADE